MMDEMVKIAVPILCLATGGLVGWVWALWQSHNNHKLEVAKEYVTHPQLTSTLKDLRRDLRFLRDLTLRIAGVIKLKISEPDDDE